MNLKYLLDTNIISEYTRNIPNKNVLGKLELYDLEICTASVVIQELLYGCFRLPESKKRQFLEKYLNNFLLSIPLFDYDLKAAKYHAEERARLAKIGKTPAFADGQIAAITVTNNLILVTNNVSDFENFNQLIIENWFI
jgi:tRNA(fMet)-specific endonuclease VapC